MAGRILAFVCSSPKAAPESARVASFEFDADTGQFAPLDSIAHTSNPSFLSVDERRSRIFVAGETGDSIVSSYGFDPATGSMHHISTQSTRGQYAAHVLTDSRGRTLFVANYSEDERRPESCGVLAYAVDPDGALSEPIWSTAFEGTGPTPGRQEATHPHSTMLSPDERLLVVPDLGGDRVYCFDFDIGTQALTQSEPPFVAMPSGSGPRHALFSGDDRFLYVANELASTVSVIDRRNGLQVVQTISTLPEGFADHSLCADLHFSDDERWLFVSNRGHDSLVCFDVDAADGQLDLMGWTPVGGSWPRNFAVDPSGRWVIVANQRSDTLSILALDASTGALSDTECRVSIAQPKCLKFASLDALS